MLLILVAVAIHFCMYFFKQHCEALKEALNQLALFKLSQLYDGVRQKQDKHFVTNCMGAQARTNDAGQNLKI